MKRVFALVLALALVLSMSVTAFASDGDGSITVTNATVGNTYTIYKIFDATISQNAQNETEAVSYTLTNEAIYNYMFGEGGKGDNFFSYEPNTKSIAKKAAADNTALITYLTKLVNTLDLTATATSLAESSEVAFKNLSYGYYVIKSTLGTAVTISSNTPHVEVIDKNQDPAVDFEKYIHNGSTWAETNTANIGEELKYKISWTGTNYDGANQINYYQIHDTKGDAICLNFDSLEINIQHAEEPVKTLTNGYYLNLTGRTPLYSGDAAFLGDWVGEKDRDKADWYLVHLSDNDFRITLPWLTNSSLKEITSDNKVTSYSLEFGSEAECKYPSPISVVVTYSGTLSPEANIGGIANAANRNSANLTWTGAHESGATEGIQSVETLCYGLGLLKDDGITKENLEGAEFRLYSDADCTQAVNVIPTDIDGVYIVDSKGSYSESMHQNYTASVDESREHIARITFKDYLTEYLGTKDQDNLVVSQVNGKLIVLGLKSGTYYLKEVKAPDGYNALASAEIIKVGEGTKAFNVFANADGEVADIQAADETHVEYIFQLTNTTVHNSKGVELPSTGGEGAMIMIGFGTFLVIFFSVFLVTQKKMSIYKD